MRPGSLLLREIDQTGIRIKSRVSNHINVKLRDVITHPCLTSIVEGKDWLNNDIPYVTMDMIIYLYHYLSYTRSRRYFHEEVYSWFFFVHVSISRVGVPSHEIDFWLDFR